MIFNKDDIAVGITGRNNVTLIYHPECSMGDRKNIEEIQTWTEEKAKKQKVFLVCDKCGETICDYRGKE